MNSSASIFITLYVYGDFVNIPVIKLYILS